ncbi:hypothetical protein L1987_65903 [Smallanthus sonchifolius]|uniref:Uncharacterized protein n=1 Tax=Smallanthus sonchifolius TaxID=185202 RepID=A0ACB9BVM0_9ASTR|nr:hypothetical protein L1987_65903 [Smallanthus sonchifolius]
MVLKNGSISTLTIPILDSAIVILVDDLEELEHRVLRLTKENATLNRLQKVIMLSFKDHGVSSNYRVIQSEKPQ